MGTICPLRRSKPSPDLASPSSARISPGFCPAFSSSVRERRLQRSGQHAVSGDGIAVRRLVDALLDRWLAGQEGSPSTRQNPSQQRQYAAHALPVGLPPFAGRTVLR